TSDLGWTYEHCFPKVETVPLSDTLVLDANALITAVEEKLRMDPGWINHGAVVVNNPHNASGHVAPAAEIERLLIFLLEHGVYVIDDLSYQNVLPRPSLDGPFTLRETAADLVRKGYLSPDRLRYLITVHSLSKTDCFAGARLAVIVVSDLNLYQRFDKLVSTITPNYMALLLAYLFYRNHTSDVRNYWLLRNRIFSERMQALEKAVNDLPVERNPFAIEIHPPMGSMYPRLVINKLPNGLSLDWLSSNLAARGIGLVPLSTFARTAIGFRVARKSFRLTLGGSDGSAILARKMRRLVIDLNHLVANEETKYNLKTISGKHTYPQLSPEIKFQWNVFSQKIKNSAPNIIKEYRRDFPLPVNRTDDFLKEFIPFRVSGFYQQLKDRFQQDYETGRFAISRQIIPTLERELFKDDLHSRTERFRKRLFDRTVHPTQIYSLKTDLAYQPIIENILSGQAPTADAIKQISKSLAEEYLGKNIALNSMDEADELIFDLRSMIAAEKFVDWHSTESIPALLSFWGDWDGSNRPSGQGHRLVAAALLENVSQLTNLLHLLKKYQPDIPVDPSLQKEMNQFPVNREKFWDLLNEITRLTNQLEKRYQGFIPLELSYGKFKKAAIRLHLSKDPLTALWQHNDRLEKRMYKMRQDRRTSLEYYFSLNKRIRKSLHQFLPQIEKQLHHAEVARAFGGYRDILKRFVLTPRIHQRIITSEDPFTVDTTAHNITEINEISGKYGNPGMVMALQVSMSTRPEALITLDRKLRAQREEILRHSIASELPPIWIIPLFEEIQPINDLTVYLDRIWSYAGSSRRIDQSREDRFSELVCEIFIAGSDLSQQVGQPAAASVYKNAKYTTLQWLAVRGLVDKVRMKFGSGEAMQRQGGFYNMDSEQPLFLRTRENKKRMENLLKRSTLESTRYAKSPLRGVLTSGDLRTFQSTISEKLRFLPLEERANLFYHLTSAQKFHDDELIRISEPFLDTRFQFQERGRQEMSSFIYGNVDPEYQKFLELHTSNFRQIIYGREEDVVGIHVISHFVSRALPELRDRPTVRPSRDMGAARGQKIIERVAQTLPLSKHGSMLRAIGHNRAQTMVLGVNQLTTGLFRAFSEFSNQQSGENDATSLLSSRILPQLPVQEILESLFYYHDPTLKYVDRLEKAFPAGNSAFLYLKEDVDSITAFVGLLQKELLRRAGMDISDFFNGNEFNPQLLPTVRPGIAILLQANLFNTDTEQFFKGIEQPVDLTWKNEVSRLLQIPQKIAFWREQIWQAVEQPIFGQVKSFVELAQAIYTIAHSDVQSKQAPTKNISEVVRFGGHVARLLRSTGDDSMRQFLTDVVQLLTQIPFTMTEIPVDIIRALRDVEKIVQIEEQVLSGKEQEQVRFYLTQMARLTGENG
ncbi:MAG: aminotransferase class I/II-fold pyridoxal phosphate-dependent enzyme, partial [Calditrichales bacterium]